MCLCVSPAHPSVWSSAGIYGGFLLGVRSVSGLAFFDWDSAELVHRIEIQPKHVRQCIPTLIIITVHIGYY